MTTRTIDMNEILDVVNAAEDCGYSFDVLMFSLYEWAQPVTDEDIDGYATYLLADENYDDEDYEDAVRNVTAWRNKYKQAAIERAKK